MEFNRNEEVPRLVSIHEVSKLQARNQLLQQARQQHPTTRQGPHPAGAGSSSQSTAELQQTILELNKQLGKLKEVNEGLIVRIREIEASYRGLQRDMEKEHQEDKRRLKNTIYREVEEYMKKVVEQMSNELRQERMTPAVEKKLEKFMSEIIEINPVSVEQAMRRVLVDDSRELPREPAYSRATPSRP